MNKENKAIPKTCLLCGGKLGHGIIEHNNKHYLGFRCTQCGKYKLFYENAEVKEIQF